MYRDMEVVVVVVVFFVLFVMRPVGRLLTEEFACNVDTGVYKL